MRRLFPFCVAAFLMLAATAPADARDDDQTPTVNQPKPPNLTKTVERPSAGLFLGATKNGDPERGGGDGGDIGFVFDTPLTHRTRVRFDATRTSWDGKQDDGHGNIIPADTITMTTMRVSLISVRRHSPHYASYSGFGLGAYHYDFARTPVTHHWHGGVHYIFGLEFLRPGERTTVNAEVRIHAMGGPGTGPETQALMFKVDAVIGMKVRF